MYPPQQIRDAVGRIVASAAFTASERMCRFLQFVVERQLAGRGSELKEYTIGIEVFDRDAKYDPRVDPIVRVEARRLRAKLRAYYEGEGKSDDLVVDLPKGSYVPRFSEPVTAAKILPAEASGITTDRTIAVLPFENTSRDTGADYLSDGLTQQIIHRLTRVHGLRVVGWTSASRMRERHDIHEVARELGASTVLVGSVRSGGGRLRISAQLIDGSNGTFLWSEFYDRGLKDLLCVEEEIAAAIVDALQVQLGLARAATGNPEAYNLYFQGRYFWNKRTEAGIRRGIALFRQALDLDPSFALAWAGLADSYILLADYSVMAPAEGMESARRAAEQALGLSPFLGEAEASLAMVRCLHDWEWDDAERHFRRAMDLNPGYATTFHWFGVDYCAIRSRWAEARNALTTALELDPLSSIIREGRGYVEMLNRSYESAISEYQRLIDMDPTFYKGWTSMGRTLIHMGDCGGAIEVLRKGAMLLGAEPPSILGALGQAHALRGDIEQARSILVRLCRLAETSYTPASAIAAVHIGLGENSEAISWLERGCEARQIPMCGLGVHPLYDPLRSDPRFTALVERIGCLR